MKNKLTEIEIAKMYKDFYSGALNKTKVVKFNKRKETKIEGLVSWVELPADSEMYKQNILVGKEVM
jgi:hypothetical protein